MEQKIGTRSKKLMVECLACDEDIFIGPKPKIGRYVTCNSCDAEFQIIDLEPVLIDWPIDDDYFDDDEGYYDDIDDQYDY